MSGVAIIRSLLAANSALTAQVPATKILAGVIPMNTVLPAISVAQISGMQNETLGMNGAKYLATDRVQVTVVTKTYPTQKQILELVRAACPNTRGMINTFACDSILPDTQGPDIYDDTNIIFFQSLDFKVTFSR